MEQFCETSSFFELDNIRNEAILRDFLIFRSARHQKRRILRDFLQKWKVECRADRLVPMCFAIFPVHLSKVLRLLRKIDARSYEVLHLSRKIILANLHIWYSKMQPFSGNQRPDLLTSLMNMSFVLRLPQKMHLCRSSSNAPRLPWFLEMLQNPHVLVTFDKVHNPLRLPCETTSEPPKMVRTWCALYIWLGNVLRSTAACTFATSQLPKVVRTWCVLYILTWKCASRHNGVHFSTSQLPKVVRSWCALHILTWKCASRHNGVHFCDISSAKSGPHLVCFLHCDLEMCCAAQRRALFHLSSGQLAPHPPL